MESLKSFVKRQRKIKQKFDLKHEDDNADIRRMASILLSMIEVSKDLQRLEKSRVNQLDLLAIHHFKKRFLNSTKKFNFHINNKGLRRSLRKTNLKK